MNHQINLMFLKVCHSQVSVFSRLRQFLADESPSEAIKMLLFCASCFKRLYFLFHIKSSFRSQDILVFVLTLW